MGHQELSRSREGKKELLEVLGTLQNKMDEDVITKDHLDQEKELDRTIQSLARKEE